MKKNKKKWIIGFSALCAIAVAATSLTILFYPRPEKSIESYILKFNTAIDENGEKQKFVTEQKQKLNTIMDQYADYHKKAYGRDFQELNLQLANLNSAQTSGELNYYETLSKSMQALDSRLKITNLIRTPQLVEQAFYNKDVDMMTFYWSPDYNSVGTWVKYVFTDEYTVPNFWPATYKALERGELPWANSLKTMLTNPKYVIGKNNTQIYMDPVDALAWLASEENTITTPDGSVKTALGVSDYYVNVANVIGKWISSNSTVDVIEQKESVYTGLDIPAADDKDVNVYQGELPLGVQYVNWISAQIPNLPFVEAGPTSKTPSLTRYGFYKEPNQNSDVSYRDWYWRPSQAAPGKNGNYNIWFSANPFAKNSGAWNPTFSKAPNTLFAASNWTGLTTWTTPGNSNDEANKFENPFLVSNGIKNDITEKSVIDTLRTEYESANPSLTFKIRPIPWVDSSGRKTQYFLSPEDYWSGFKGFARSVANGMNKNNSYFIGLLGLDFEATLDHLANKERNISSTDEKEFKIFLKNPILNIEDALDILSKQYFFALPSFSPLVQNIVDDARYTAIAGNGAIDENNVNMNLFYGSGDLRGEQWKNLYSAAPYYISNITTQTIFHTLNPYYFEAFDDVKTKKAYEMFNLKKDGMEKINKLNVNYAGSYNDNILFEQFKSGEQDASPIKASNLSTALKLFPKDVSYTITDKIGRSNVAGFNLQIYERWFEPVNEVPAGKARASNIIVGEDGRPLWNPTTRTPTYTIDQWGNYDFSNCHTKPKLKPHISRSYADLIVRDFFTPAEEGGVSQVIRGTILNSINWVSLKSLYSPGISQSIQYSFMPYGVYNLKDADGDVPVVKYWDVIANKRYMTYAELTNGLSPEQLQKRRSGIILWTYDELLKSMIRS